MTESSVYLTTTAQAERAVAIAAAKKAALKHIDAVAAEKRGEFKQVRKLDGLGLLYKAGELTDDMHRVGQKYHKAYVMCSGLMGKNILNQTPSGSVDDAMQARIDAGAVVRACEACCSTSGELLALRSFVGDGDSIRSKVSGRKHREMTDLVVSVLEKMVKARL